MGDWTVVKLDEELAWTELRALSHVENVEDRLRAAAAFVRGVDTVGVSGRSLANVLDDTADAMETEDAWLRIRQDIDEYVHVTCDDVDLHDVWTEEVKEAATIGTTLAGLLMATLRGEDDSSIRRDLIVALNSMIAEGNLVIRFDSTGFVGSARGGEEEAFEAAPFMFTCDRPEDPNE